MSKLNHMLTLWVSGDIHSLTWMRSLGVSQKEAFNYYKRGFLDKIGPGIYKRKGESPHWTGLVRLLQQELGKALHVSGRSALEFQGAAHQMPAGLSTGIQLCSFEKVRLPQWFKDIGAGVEFSFRRSGLFSRESALTSLQNNGGIEINLSSRELAYLELLNNLDLSESFETAENYLSGLPGLRVGVLQDLLEDCSSIKIKRVFLYLSERLQKKYFPLLDISRLDLGQGKRQIIKHGGRLDKKYKITVPSVREESRF